MVKVADFTEGDHGNLNQVLTRQNLLCSCEPVGKKLTSITAAVVPAWQRIVGGLLYPSTAIYPNEKANISR